MCISHIAPGSKLLDSCGTESIRCSKHDFLSLILITQAEFTGSGRFTCSVYTYHQNDIEVIIFDVQCFLLTEDIQHLGAHDTDNGIFAVITGLLDRITDLIHDLQTCADAAVCLYQKSFKIIQHIFIKTSHGSGDLRDTFRHEVSCLLKTSLKNIK